MNANWLLQGKQAPRHPPNPPTSLKSPADTDCLAGGEGMEGCAGSRRETRRDTTGPQTSSGGARGVPAWRPRHSMASSVK